MLFGLRDCPFLCWKTTKSKTTETHAKDRTHVQSVVIFTLAVNLTVILLSTLVSCTVGFTNHRRSYAYLHGRRQLRQVKWRSAIVKPLTQLRGIAIHEASHSKETAIHESVLEQEICVTSAQILKACQSGLVEKLDP